MRRTMAAYLDELAADDDIKVVILRGSRRRVQHRRRHGELVRVVRVQRAESRRPSQRRRLGVDRESFALLPRVPDLPEGHRRAGRDATRSAVRSSSRSWPTSRSSARDAKLGMPGAQLLGPALGNLHLFFHRLGPVLARRLLLTGDVVTAGELEHLGLFTEVCDPDDGRGTRRAWASEGGADAGRRSRHRQDQLRAGRADAGVRGRGGHRLPACTPFATNLRFEDDEFNFVKARAKVGTSEAFKVRDRALRGRRPAVNRVDPSALTAALAEANLAVLVVRARAPHR